MISKLLKAGIESAGPETKIMLEEAFGHDFTWLFLHNREEVAAEAIERLGAMLERRKAGEPLQYIIGKANFMGLDIAVGPGVLIPRPETERLCELTESEVLELCGAPEKCLQSDRGDTVKLRFLDLCTGSGCIAAYLAERFPDSDVSACDISSAALEFAGRNCPERVKLFQGDLFEAIPPGEEPYDIIISNPPYIPSGKIASLEPEVKAWEPSLALDGGEDGMDTVSRIIREAPKFLSPGGLLFMEIDENCGAAALRAASLSGAYEEFEIYKDLNARDRYLRAKKKLDF
ncbi:MAG: peptide chain release factor N(5)-glutamine methyltransferase [Clostridiales bacterium]|nr:peptide chain release factor N(5)-glutamine methyltransferase [Clostridiales bacterium]